MILRGVNLGVRFLLELAALAALGAWGFAAGGGLLSRLALGLGAPLLAALAWGAFVAPRARWRLSMPWRLGPELAVFGSGVLALVGLGHAGLATAMAATVAVNEVLVSVLGQR